LATCACAVFEPASRAKIISREGEPRTPANEKRWATKWKIKGIKLQVPISLRRRLEGSGGRWGRELKLKGSVEGLGL